MRSLVSKGFIHTSLSAQNMTDPTGMSRKKESDGHSSDGPVFVRPTPGSEGEKLRENESELIIRNALESDTAKGIELLFR